MKVYISGKITNDPDFKEKFKKAVYYLIENKETLFPEENEISYFPAKRESFLK